MNGMTLKILAKELGVRPVRLSEKLGTLKMYVDGTGILSNEQVGTLVMSYVESSRVGERTREAALGLLQQIELGEDILENDEKKKSKKIKPTKNKDKPVPSIPAKPKVKGYSMISNAGIKFRKGISGLMDAGISALLSHRFKFVALLIAIIVQMQHSAAWFYRLSSNVHGGSWTTAYGYAFMVDLFILVITLEGKRYIAQTFAVLTFLSNVLYFQFWVGYENNLQSLTNAVSCIMVSGVIAYIIFAYTEIFVQSKK